ncbi:MAG: hypothetical protein KDD56_04620 [Bdellovibrionales bacterium]|nr:hypothetical protein [Bdellovibrionales bacterium]
MEVLGKIEKVERSLFYLSSPENFTKLERSLRECFSLVRALDKELASFEPQIVLEFATQLGLCIDPNLLTKDHLVPKKTKELLKRIHDYFNEDNFRKAFTEYVLSRFLKQLESGCDLDSADCLACELLEFWYEPDDSFKTVTGETTKIIANKIFESDIIATSFLPGEDQDLLEVRKQNLVRKVIDICADVLNIPKPDSIKTNVYYDGKGRFSDQYYSIMVSIFEHEFGSAWIISKDLLETAVHEMRHAFQAIAANWICKKLKLPNRFMDDEVYDAFNQTMPIIEDFPSETLIFYLIFSRQSQPKAKHAFSPRLPNLANPLPYDERDAENFACLVSNQIEELVEKRVL